MFMAAFGTVTKGVNAQVSLKLGGNFGLENSEPMRPVTSEIWRSWLKLDGKS